jgi:hypothetical protein
MNVASWFVAAALYSVYFPTGANALAYGFNVSTAESMVHSSYSANFAEANSTGAPPRISHAAEVMQSLHANVNATGANLPASKIGDLPLFMIVATLAVALLVAVLSLSFTIKREYLHTFVSPQTGRAYAQSYFLDNEGDDARRIEIFFHNERQWQAIRNRVREWVLGMYAVWQALMPSWFTTDLQARIPDDVMPAQVVSDLNAQTPKRRRPTLQNMDFSRRLSQATVVTAEGSPSSDGLLRIPTPSHPQPASSQMTVGLLKGAISETHGAEAVDLEEAVEPRSSLKPGGSAANLKLGDSGLGLRDLARLRYTYELMYTPKIWTATDERRLKLTDSAEVSKLASLCIARHTATPR